jgi:hypothetical protein
MTARVVGRMRGTPSGGWCAGLYGRCLESCFSFPLHDRAHLYHDECKQADERDERRNDVEERKLELYGISLVRSMAVCLKEGAHPVERGDPATAP